MELHVLYIHVYVNLPSISIVVEESDNHDTKIVSRVVAHRVVEQFLGRVLWILDATDEIDCVLVLTDVPELLSESSGHGRGHAQSQLTPSHATIRNSSPSSSTVSVVYGAPTTNSFIEASPSDRVTASTPGVSMFHHTHTGDASSPASQGCSASHSPLTRLFITKPPASVIRLASWLSLPL